jgi:hypothetical protein
MLASPGQNGQYAMQMDASIAPNDGFTRSEIWGFNFSVISGHGQFF